jgi:small-conductance mechanosensitive channel
VIFVVLAVVAVMMALSALGVEIGPLIAGAGIVGVAVGFGSQTLVKDVSSAASSISSTTPSGSASTSRAAVTRERWNRSGSGR